MASRPAARKMLSQAPNAVKKRAERAAATALRKAAKAGRLGSLDVEEAPAPARRQAPPRRAPAYEPDYGYQQPQREYHTPSPNEGFTQLIMRESETRVKERDTQIAGLQQQIQHLETSRRELQTKYDDLHINQRFADKEKDWAVKEALAGVEPAKSGLAGIQEVLGGILGVLPAQTVNMFAAKLTGMPMPATEVAQLGSASTAGLTPDHQQLISTLTEFASQSPENAAQLVFLLQIAEGKGPQGLAQLVQFVQANFSPLA